MGANATVGTFIAVVVAHLMADFMGMSVWPVYKTLAGLDVAKAGWIATVIGMSGTALQPLFGLIADRFGPRRVILLGTLLTSFALLLGPLVDYQSALDRRLPTLFGLSGFYLVVFMILAAGRLGQDMFHPSGAGLAGSFSARRGSNHGGSSSFSPRCSFGSSMAKPISEVAISTRMPPGERQ